MNPENFRNNRRCASFAKSNKRGIDRRVWLVATVIACALAQPFRLWAQNEDFHRAAGDPHLGPTVTGTDAIHFDGFSMVNFGGGPIPYYLVGNGLVTLNSNGTLEGKQTSSTTPLSGATAQILVCTYSLSGTYVVNSDGTGTATIDFTPTGTSIANCATETGTFSLVVVNPEHLWLISTGATSPNGPLPDEVVKIEAVRVN
jgi:hypothetical protein